MLKKILIGLTLCALGAGSIKAGDNRYLEYAKIWSHGHAVIVLYSPTEHLAFLILPDGRRIDINYDPDISVKTLDASLQRLADQETK
jgi:hypothetical protein